MALGKVPLILLLLGIASAADSVCRGLSLEGGGTHGAYEAGAVYSLTQNLPPIEVLWDIISGISTGSINTGISAHFAYGDEIAMAEYLIGTWLLIQNQSMIAPPWPGSTFHSLFFRPSLCNTEPFRQFLTSRFGTSIERNVTVGATNLVTGEFTDFTEEVGHEDLITAVMCSAAPPFAFPPIQFQNSWYVDGGVTLNIDAFAVINRCRDLGYADEDIVLDLIYDYPKVSTAGPKVNNTRQALERINYIVTAFNKIWYSAQIFHAYPLVNFRYVVYPSQRLPPNTNGVPLDFDPKDMLFEINLGKSDGLNAIFNVKGREEHLSDIEEAMPKVHYF